MNFPDRVKLLKELQQADLGFLVMNHYFGEIKTMVDTKINPIIPEAFKALTCKRYLGIKVIPSTYPTTIVDIVNEANFK